MLNGRRTDFRYNTEDTLLMIIEMLTKGTQQEEIGKEISEKARAVFDYYSDKEWDIKWQWKFDFKCGKTKYRKKWLIIGLNIGYLTSDKEDSELYTPAYAVDPIIKYLPKDKIIWCPFSEEWSMFYKRLKEVGFKVVRSSLVENKDFFEYTPEEFDLIVDNPPFSIKDKVLERLYSFNKPFAVLLPLNSLQGKTRYKYFKQGIQILSFDARVSYHDKDHMDSVVKGSPFATAYFCRDLLPKDLIIEKLVTYERSLLM